MTALPFSLDDHLHFMELTVKLAEHTLNNDETPVACIFVDKTDKKIVSYGMNMTNQNLNGISHAEFIAIDKLLSINNNDITRINFNDVIVYVTVEPCIMCASALKQLGINYIVFGCGNERFGGNGTVLSIQNDDCTKRFVNSNNNIETTLIPGIMRKECIFLLRLFYHKENDTAPSPRLKKKRQLDRDEFPLIDWSIYVTQAEFISIYGENNARNFIHKTDINECSKIRWHLIESQNSDGKNIDNIIQYLDTCINGNNEHKFKRPKMVDIL